MKDKDTIARTNLGLVHACCKRFIGKGIEYDELYSAGCLGLAKAINNFDENLGYKFSTYAFTVIIGEIKLLFRDSGCIKVSRNLKELSISISNFCDSYRKINGTEPAVSCIAQALDVSTDRVVDAVNSSRYPISLTTDEDDDGCPIEIPVDDIQYEVSDRITLEDALNMLPPLDLSLIRLRYYAYKTQAQTAELLGMTQVQVSRREKKILALIRTKIS